MEKGLAEETIDEKMNPNGPTIYDVWKPADGLFKAEATAKTIYFRSRSESSDGFVRVVGGEEGYTTGEIRSFFVPPNHSCEVLGCEIKFTRA
ncbi:hypothetical protein DTO217A2_543 [Paecilomyces variotii]|nr:hypothetical protein DTO217A2_543 [Paecilomyces variotii]